MPKENASYKCLSLIMLDSVNSVTKKHYLQTFLEECKYEIKKNKTENLINDDLDPSSSDNYSKNDYFNSSSSDESDSESDIEPGN